MLRYIVELSIRHRGVVIALAGLMLVYGVFVAMRAKVDVFPEFSPPQVVIQTEAPGFSPEQVEALVTRPIENAVNGVIHLESIRSQSIQGLSVITVVFGEGTDIFRARQMVGQRLMEATPDLPGGIKPPRMAPLTSSTSRLLVVGLTSPTRSPMELRTFADWTLRPRLLSVPGVAKVVIYGGQVRQFQIQMRPERLAAYGLAMDDVLAAARRATGVRAGGFVQTPAQRIVVQTSGQALTPKALGQAIVANRQGAVIRLQDVAHVVCAAEPKFGDAAVQGEPGVAMIVSGQYGTNTLETTRAVERALGDLQPLCDAEQITLHPRLFRPANFIEMAIRNIKSSLLIGAVLVAAILFVLLMNLRTALISLTAIPLSLLGAVIVLDRFGATLNTMTLGGLAIAIGEVVDDAIIDVENVLRRLRLNAATANPRPRFHVVLEASLEVRSAVVYATFIVAMVFLPVLTMSGIQGRMFAPLGMAYILAILASLAVALTVTPAMSYLLLGAGAQRTADSPLAVFLKTRYRGLLAGLTGRPKLVIAGVGLLCVAAVAALPFFGGQFLPEFQEGNFILHMSAAAGTSIQESLRLGRRVTAALLENPNIRSVTQRVGRAELGDDIFGTHYSEFDVDLVPLSGDVAEEIQPQIRRVVAGFPGAYFAVTPFLTERIEETLSGISAAVVVKIFGNDLDGLDRAARRVAEVVRGIPGAADVQVLSPPSAPQMSVRLRRDRLTQFGFQPLEVLEDVAGAYQGTVVGQTYQGNRVVDVAVIADPKMRQVPEGLKHLLLRSPSGQNVPLGELADIAQTTGRYAVMHEAAQRFQAVTCNVRGRDAASFVEQLKRNVRSKVAFPAGSYPVFAGTAAAQAQAQHEMLLYSAGAAVAIVLLLSLALHGARNVVLVLANLPFALVGGVVAVFASGGWLSLGSLVGFVTLFGITTRNSIMLVSHYEHLVAVEGMAWGRETAMRGAGDRLIPIAATALTTALGLLPLAIGSGDPGREIEGPMAIVILGGLATSTVLNLLVLPTLAMRLGRFETRVEHG